MCGIRWKGELETYSCMEDETYDYGRSNNIKVTRIFILPLAQLFRNIS